MQSETVLSDQGDIFQQQPHHTFPFAVGCRRVAPDTWKIRSEREDRRALLLIDELSILCSLAFADFLRLRQQVVPYDVVRKHISALPE